MITSKEMMALDINCRYHGIDTLQLMENAGKAVADEIKKRFDNGKVVVFAGSGNNAGDGFVAARHLKGFDVEIYLISDTIKSEVAKKNLEILYNAGYKIYRGLNEKPNAEIIIDAMLGTGFKGELKGNYRKAVEIINSIDAFKVAVDVPSGLNPDTGDGYAVKCDLTVTFHKMKPGLLKAKDVCGEIVVADIGIPEFFEKLTGPGDVKITYKRWEDAHKGMHGKVLVVGGSPYVGAPALTALAAYSAGADIVTLLVPESIYNITASFSPEIITRKLKGDEITEDNVEEIVEYAKRHDVVVFGIGTENKAEVAEEISKYVNKIVLDAGGISSSSHCNSIITPHKNEFKRVFGEYPDERILSEIAKEKKMTILLKGKVDVITDGMRVKYNKSGNAGMTVGGTGDVLAGVCGAFFAIEDDAFSSASASAFVTGLAGDLCFREKGYNYTAMDVIKKIPDAIKFSLDF